MTKRGFYFDHTCPDINRQIREAQELIEAHIYEIVAAISPDMPKEERGSLAKTEADDLYEALGPIFENTRQTNVDMRAAAEYQIADLESDIEDLKQEIDDLTKQNNT